MPIEEVIWDPPEHTKAKHKILKGYLDAWAPIMSQQAARSRSRPPLYIDAFAGPGIYRDGSDGSPVVAIKSVINHTQSFPKPIRMSFIELHKERFKSLTEKITEFESHTQPQLIIEEKLNTTCHDGLRQLIDTEIARYNSFSSTLVFLDQFGYSHAPMEMIGELMSGTSCEALVYLDYQRMNHTLSDPNKATALTKAFGSPAWENCKALEGSERVVCLRNAYKNALYEAGAAFAWDFEMRGLNNELISWLFFCTSNERGLEEMKKAMHKLDLTGNFRFSDRDVGQFNLLAKSFDRDWLANHLHNLFKEKTVEHGDIRRHVLTETPSIKYKEALILLEKEGKIRVVNPPPGRRRGSFNFDDSILIEFLADGGEQISLF